MHIVQNQKSAILQRAQERRARIVTHRAASFDEAERWDLAYWQSTTPQERLSALVAIREDVDKVKLARQKHELRR
jgi:hypothetical protein